MAAKVLKFLKFNWNRFLWSTFFKPCSIFVHFLIWISHLYAFVKDFAKRPSGFGVRTTQFSGVFYYDFDTSPTLVSSMKPRALSFERWPPGQNLNNLWSFQTQLKPISSSEDMDVELKFKTCLMITSILLTF